MQALLENEYKCEVFNEELDNVVLAVKP